MLLKDALSIDENERSAIRAEAGSFYRIAYEVTRGYGVGFAEFVHSRAPEDALLTVCCNGAEHLGTILECFARKRRLPQTIHYNFLTERVAAPWKLLAENTIDGDKYQVGYGPLPPPSSYLWRVDRNGLPGNPERELLEYVRDERVFSKPALSVIDVGFLGTIPEVVGSLARSYGYCGEIEGLLFQYVGDAVSVNHRLPIAGFAPNRRSAPDAYRAAYLLDSGITLEEETFDDDNPPQERAFRKSRLSPARLRNDSGRWVPDTPLFSAPELVAQYKATIIGIEDAIHDCG